jgi:hypothetical protein
MQVGARLPRWLLFFSVSFALAGTLFSESHPIELSETTEDRIDDNVMVADKECAGSGAAGRQLGMREVSQR